MCKRVGLKPKLMFAHLWYHQYEQHWTMSWKMLHDFTHMPNTCPKHRYVVPPEFFQRAHSCTAASHTSES